jgi:hypothetical protein
VFNIAQSSRAGNAPLPVDPDGIPAELRALPRWVGWILEPRGIKKPAKRPICPRTGKPADVTNLGHFVGFDDALAFYHDHNLDGIGFGFFAIDRFAGVDIDTCRDPESGLFDPVVVNLLAVLDTYAEVSPSGTGARAIGIGKLDPAGRKKSGNLEIYDRARFLTVTGHRIPTAPSTVEPRENELRRLQASLGPPPQPSTRIASAGSFDGRDHELLARAFAAPNGAWVQALWNGHHNKPSASEALLGLARLLAFWTGPDPARLERPLLDSPLFAVTEQERAKWLSPRQVDTWGQLYVVRKAIESCPEFFGTGSKLTVLGEPEASPGAEKKTHTCVSRHGMQFAGLSAAWNRVLEGEFPDGLDTIPGRTPIIRFRRQQVAALCWHLSLQSFDHRFFLAEADAGRLVGVCQSTIGRWLKLLRSKPLRLIHRIRQGNSFRGRASEYAWLVEPQQLTNPESKRAPARKGTCASQNTSAPFGATT